MQTISTGQELKNRIEYLEQRAKQQEQQLKTTFNQAFESIKPQNLLRNAFSDAADEPDIRNNFINTAVGLASGFISRKIIIGSTAGIVRKLAGTAIQYGITKYISNNLSTLVMKLQSMASRSKKTAKNTSGEEDIDDEELDLTV